MNRYEIPIYGEFEDVEFEDEEKLLFSKENITELLEQYLSNDCIEYQRIGWLYKRISHINVSTALIPTLWYIDDLLPILQDVSKYFLSLADDKELDINGLGDSLLDLLSKELVVENEYLQLLILNIFAANC